jgi:hypothetical protein
MFDRSYSKGRSNNMIQYHKNKKSDLKNLNNKTANNCELVVHSEADYFITEEYAEDYFVTENYQNTLRISAEICPADSSSAESRIDIKKTINFKTLLQTLYKSNIDYVLPEDAEDKITVNGCSKQLFSEKFQSLCSEERIDFSLQGKLLKLLQDSIQNSNFPVKLKKNGSSVSTAERYCRKSKDHRTIFIDICCANGCTVFFDENASKVRCLICNSRRFKICWEKSCIGTDYDLCAHSLEQRISMKTLRFRPLTPLLYELLGHDHFLKALKYTYNKPKADCQYWDILDGSTSKKNIKEMEKIFFSKYGDRSDIIMVNILISQNYDGCQVYSNQCSSFWPLTITILNLPPSYRTKLGIGTFLIGVLTTKIPSAAESFFYSDLFVNELKLLSGGILIRGKFFVQVRLILSCLDTKAMEYHLKIQSVGAKEGCGLCEVGKGTSVKGLKICSIGCRRLLHRNHYVRNIGQSCKCCPLDYYDNFKDNFEAFDDPKTVKRMRLTQYIEDFVVCDQTNSKNIYNFLNDKDAEFVWYHKHIPYNFFNKFMFYHHADYRPQVKHVRKSNSEYKKNGDESIKLNKPVNGVKGVWPEYDLPYTNVATDLNWDTFHIFATISRNITDNWKGERLKTKTVKFCKQTNSHPSLYCTDFDSTLLNNQPWAIPVFLQKKVLYFCIVIIKYYKI